MRQLFERSCGIGGYWLSVHFGADTQKVWHPKRLKIGRFRNDSEVQARLSLWWKRVLQVRLQRVEPETTGQNFRQTTVAMPCADALDKSFHDGGIGDIACR